MTESEIASIENEIADYNSVQEEKALAKFKKGPVPKMKWVMEKNLECLLGCIAAVKSGKPPIPSSRKVFLNGCRADVRKKGACSPTSTS